MLCAACFSRVFNSETENLKEDLFTVSGEKNNRKGNTKEEIIAYTDESWGKQNLREKGVLMGSGVCRTPPSAGVESVEGGGKGQCEEM